MILVPAPFFQRYKVNSADFDGTNDYLLRGGALSDVANSKKGICSFWFRIDGGGVGPMYVAQSLAGGVNNIEIARSSVGGGVIAVSMTSATGPTSVLYMQTTTAYTNSATWHHCLASWDVSIGATHLYIDDVSDKDGGSLVAVNADVEYVGMTNCGIGASTTGANKFNGCLADFYLNLAEYLDLSVESNRRKFVSANLKPKYLGANGASPTGTTPIVFQSLGETDSVANDFAINHGSGGSLSVTGALTIGDSSPSD